MAAAPANSAVAKPPASAFPIVGISLFLHLAGWWVAVGALGVETPPSSAVPSAMVGDLSPVDERQWVEAVSRRKQRLETSPQAVVVVTGDELIGTPALTIPDRLRYVAGIDVYQQRHGQYDLGIHGYNGVNNSRVLALDDGRDFSLEEFGSVLWLGTLISSDISRLEIVKGPGSVTYGANAFGGVIAIQDRKPGDRHQLVVVADAGTAGRREADITALGPLGRRAYYKVSAGGSLLDDLPGVTGYDSHVPSSRTASSGDTDLESVRYRLRLGCYPVQNSQDWRAEAEYLGLDLRQWDFVEDLDTGSNHAAIVQDEFGLRLVAPWGELRQLCRQARKDYSNQKAFYDPALDYRYAQAAFQDRTDTTRLQLNLPAGNHFVSGGGEFFRWRSRSNLWAADGVYSDSSTWGTVETCSRALFLEDQWEPAPAWTATGGLRLDDQSQVGANWSPRLALNYRPDADAFWRLSWSRGYRLPTGVETYLRKYYFCSDPDLAAETIQEIGLGWNRRFDRGINLGANLFASRSNGHIWALPLDAAQMAANWNAWRAGGSDPNRGPGPFFAFRNLDDPVEVLGLELTHDWRLGDLPLTLWGNGTWQRYRHRDDIIYRSDGFVDTISGATMFRFDRNLGRTIDAPPQWKANLGLRWESGRAFASLAGRYVSGREVFSFANSYFDLGSPIETEIVPAYLVCDLGCGWSFGPDRYRRFLRLSVLNLFDHRHYESFQARATTLIDTMERQYTSEIGRSVALQGGWEF
jgi:outer membrane receptor protein involved in Fe transport